LERAGEIMHLEKNTAPTRGQSHRGGVVLIACQRAVAGSAFRSRMYDRALLARQVVLAYRCSTRPAHRGSAVRRSHRDRPRASRQAENRVQGPRHTPPGRQTPLNRLVEANHFRSCDGLG
jgi:hypothetical protein